ncbi:DUF308 domain-containing protein [Butyricicoccus faecihominis]|uniref:HdeD family acid-resistance protein n=1 Tax=Butyricicoccaceae TaxID=3085642 RepID=UPI002478B6AA|nr:DUF308 domain-containing protein [Agathobaculum sp. NTUH-O15-33]MCQ5128117.1 DUF308 domain-containing protein [Butyricicoccus faecihominis]WNX86420.1 DUF308 domain-containing protein [Agathobaculum sp. NTUH-O15-33]
MKDSVSRALWGAAGLFLVVTGVYFIIHPDATLVSIAFMMGLALLVSGGANLIVYVTRRRAYLASGWFLADGLVDVLIGLAFLCNRWIATSLLPFIFAVWAVISGLTKLVNASILRRFGSMAWGWSLVIGIILAALGVATFIKPLVAAVAIAVLVAVVLIAQGLLAIMRCLFISDMYKK